MPRTSYSKGGKLADRSSRTRKASSTPSQSLSDPAAKKAPSTTKSKALGSAAKPQAAKTKSKRMLASIPALNPDTKTGEPRKRKSGKRAALEVRQLQNSTHRLISCAGFAQEVKHVVHSLILRPDGLQRSIRYQRGALALLQEASEAYVIGMFQDAQSLCSFVGRKTVMQKDLAFVRKLRDHA